MDWKVFVAAFGTIFLAELGDKTQLANLSLSAKSGSVVSVFAGSIAGFGLVTLLTVLFGGILSRFIRPEYVRYGAATLFVTVGLLMFSGKM